jgi:hypothetical protein
VRQRDLLILLAASLLATVPVWIPTLPPMTDLPDHAAQIALLHQMHDPAFAYTADFQINWLTPYWFGYLLAYGLAPLVGIVVACQIVITAALVALPLATALILTETTLDRRWALLTIPSMYGFSYHWGFFNFLVAAPLGLVFVWLVLRQTRQATATRALLLAALSILLFFCHALICAFFGLIGAAMLLTSGGSVREGVRRVLPLASVLPVVVLWGSYAIAHPHAMSATTWDLNWFTTSDGYYRLTTHTHGDWETPVGAGWGRVTGLFPRMLGALPGLLPTIIGLASIALPFVAGARLTRRPTRWIPFGFCIGTLLFAPSLMLGVAFIFQRFTVFAMPLWLMTLAQPQAPAHAWPARAGPAHVWPKWTWPACGLLAASWIGVVSMNAMLYESDAAGFSEILARMQPGERALSLVFERDSAGTIAPPFLHYPVWYAALRGGVVDPSAAGTITVPVSYRPEREPMARVSRAFEWTPEVFDWPSFEGGRYRYFIVRASKDVGPSLLRDTRLVHHTHHWWLYEHKRAHEP